MPGDVVLGRDGGVLFIPPQPAQRVVEQSERAHLRDNIDRLPAARPQAQDIIGEQEKAARPR